MTALPVVETQAGDVSAYIPTNVISLLLMDKFFQRLSYFIKVFDQLLMLVYPLVGVGSAAQLKTMKKVSGSLKLELAQLS